VVDRLKKIMIRHTKSQRIGGQVALSLPETDQATVWLDMSDDEALSADPLTPYPSPLTPHLSPLTPHPYPSSLVRSPLIPYSSPLTPHPSPSPVTPHPLPSQVLIYNLHGCKDGRCDLDSDRLAHEVKNRRKACAHLYSQEAVHGLLATEEEKAEYPSGQVPEYYSLESCKPGGTFATATAAFLRLHERREVQEKVHVWRKREQAAGNYMGKNGVHKVELEEGQTHLLVEQWVPKPHLLTKYKALLADLEALHVEEPNMRVVIFTEYDEVQEQLVDMLRSQVTKSGGGSRSAAGRGAAAGLSSSTRSSRLAARGGAAGASDSPDGVADRTPVLGPNDLDGGEEGEDGTDQGAATGAAARDAKDGAAAGAGLSGLQLFEFNATTAPVARHKRIKDFQGGGDDGAKVFVVTYRTAAVGITLTAANRVYLFEPALDPAQEVQAAGRIHRLGQTKEVIDRLLNLGPINICRSADLVSAVPGPHQALLLPQFNRGGRG
jgi:hypothetical protein